ncbi:sirohydrochlorin cobaltochelatase [Clostridium sp. Mt-5]|uniref:Sirohydrochlorin cobaltochelatase n=1 Tax=Clostridium moutaii TaxID=3240932 RepID=A0ABV4BP27_9CLOT
MSILKKGILVVSFGTSVLKALKNCIQATEQEIGKEFKGYEVRRAFTSGVIIRKLKREMKLNIDTVSEALDKMKYEGFSEVYVQPLHIMPGDEYDKIICDVKKYEAFFDRLIVGKPVLYRKDDYTIAAEALKSQIPDLREGEAVVLMGHGSSHPCNASYVMFQYILDDMGMKKIFVGTVEGYPVIENIIPKLKENKIRNITLMPFMLVAGDHALNDMAGEDSSSWKEILKNKGFQVSTYIHGLGENKAFQKIYVQHVKDCIKGNLFMNEKVKV